MIDLEAIFTRAVLEGEKRLDKSGYATGISAFIAGFYVTFGGLMALTTVGMMSKFTGNHAFGWFLGSFFYPIGFIFVVIGRSELFTENFLLPVLAVWEKRGNHRQLVKLWTLGFVFNVIGVLFIVSIIRYSGLLTVRSELGPVAVEQFVRVAEHALSESYHALIWKAIFAGLFINFMSWLIVACKGPSLIIPIIWFTTFPIMLLGTHHSIVGSSEILLGLFHGADGTVQQWFLRFLIPVAVGNHVGGVVFVAFLHYLQRFFHLDFLELDE